MAITMYSAAQMYIGTGVAVLAPVATPADTIPITRLRPMEMPLPVPRWAEGKTSGVYAYSVP